MVDLYDEPSCVDDPNMVECEHCGEMFDKIDVDGEDICPECMGKIKRCYNCDERLWPNDGHIVDAMGRQFCSTGCQEEYMEYWFKKVADLKRRGGAK